MCVTLLGVPPFCQHGDRHEQRHMLAWLPRLARRWPPPDAVPPPLPAFSSSDRHSQPRRATWVSIRIVRFTSDVFREVLGEDRASAVITVLVSASRDFAGFCFKASGAKLPSSSARSGRAPRRLRIRSPVSVSGLSTNLPVEDLGDVGVVATRMSTGGHVLLPRRRGPASARTAPSTVRRSVATRLRLRGIPPPAWAVSPCRAAAHRVPRLSLIALHSLKYFRIGARAGRVKHRQGAESSQCRSRWRPPGRKSLTIHGNGLPSG